MLFNSFEFIFIFLPITLMIYFILNYYDKEKLSKVWLVLVSLFFYGYFNYSYLIIIISSILINYFLGNLLYINKKNNLRKFWLILGLVFNIGILGYFKYYNFFITNINYIFKSNISLLNIILPLGISFFTFQQLSFLVDNYKRKSLKYDFLSYCLFVTFFPQLIAGPIVLPEEMLSQFENKENKKINYKNLNKGLYIFLIGLSKKVIIADTISCFANTGFDQMKQLTFFEGWLTSVAYTLQLYFDFSGYCDMAIGIGLMFNIILPINFNSPYRATNIQEFWKKWHITLGRFLTNYLYIPLGGNRKGNKRTLINLLIVFFISGIWHGAGWTFIIWGLFHGISILCHRLWKNKGLKMPQFFGWIITIFLVNIFWIFFRANKIENAFLILKGMINIKSFKMLLTSEYLNQLNPYLGKKETFIILFVAIILVLLPKNSISKINQLKYNKRYFLEQIIYFMCSLLLINRVATFLYFNF